MRIVRDAARSAKKAYEEAVSRRSGSQRELNDLLQRKSSWNESDVLRFTELVRADHTRETEESTALATASEADSDVERQFNELMRSILDRYHEEQVWSDKIRSLSTYGSLTVLGLNLFVFILALVLVEPWKRRRLLQTFEEKVVLFTEDNQRHLEARLDKLAEHQETQAQQFIDAISSNAHLPHSQTPTDVVSVQADMRVPHIGATKLTLYDVASDIQQNTLFMTTIGAMIGGLVGVLWSLGNY